MRWAALAFLLLATPAAADVVSKAPDAVEVTIYRDQPETTAQLRKAGAGDTHGLALITETRIVDLPAEATRLKFEGVADGIIPQSATVEGLPAGVSERNFDYDLLNPGSLVAHYVGQNVTLVRTNLRTGKESRESAVVRSGPDGVVLQTAHGIEALRCSGEAERLVFDHAPEGLADRPTLSVLTKAGAPGRYKLRVSYLSVRMDWSADYIARIAADGKSLDLTGWITLANRSSASFADAPTAVVAGHLSRTAVILPRVTPQTLAPNCWPMATTSTWYPPPVPPVPVTVAAPMAMAMNQTASRGMVVVTAAKARTIAVESALGDYKLYTLPNPTTVAAQQTKQVLFLHQDGVKFETVYSHQIIGWPDYGPSPPEAASVVMRLQNKPENGLGRDLPQGQVSLRQSQPGAGGREQFLGQPNIRDVPVGEPFELTVGTASDVSISQRLVSTVAAGTHTRRAIEVTAVNAKTAPVVVELRQSRQGIDGFRVIAESLAHGEKAGDPVWRVTLPAGGRVVVSYAVELEL